MPKLWMGGVGTLCAIAHYRATLFTLFTKDKQNIDLLWQNGPEKISDHFKIRIFQSIYRVKRTLRCTSTNRKQIFGWFFVVIATSFISTFHFYNWPKFLFVTLGIIFHYLAFIFDHFFCFCNETLVFFKLKLLALRLLWWMII